MLDVTLTSIRETGKGLFPNIIAHTKAFGDNTVLDVILLNSHDITPCSFPDSFVTSVRVNLFQAWYCRINPFRAV